MLFVEIVSFGLALWLGLHLIQRYQTHTAMPALIWASGGLISYSMALAINVIGKYSPTPLGDLLQQQIAFLIAPMIFWVGTLWHLRKPIGNLRETWKSGANSAGTIGLVLAATIFFSLGIGLILAPFELIPPNWLFIAISGDLLLLGYAIGVLDAFELGETHLPSFVRSALEAEFTAFFFGLQVGLAMWWVGAATFPLVVLLFAVVTSAILIIVFARQIQGFLDQLIFNRYPGLSEERSLLREVTEMLPKSPHPIEPNLLSADNFSKHTRTALSQLGNLPKLATNPLIHMPIIEKRLIEKEADTHTLTRAVELKQVLIESIDRLKPDPAVNEFKNTKGWRHYNALHFPYAKGLRPYGRRSELNGLSSTELEALEWFDQEVPPRTLYNWQTAGAKIIANDLQEQNEILLMEHPDRN